MHAPLSPPVLLPHLRIVHVTGTDSTRFLQAQLSRGVEDLSAQESRLAGWHDARGKVRAVFRVLRSPAGYLLEAPADIAEQLVTTLRMFVLRADVGIELTELVCAGIVASAQESPGSGVPAEAASLPSLPQEPNAVSREDGMTAVCIAPGCWHVFGPADTLSLQDAADCEAIVAAEILAALPFVDRHSTLRYVPHMLNLDVLGALDFRKGCYPGQEIIARTEHLGSVKRRARVFRTDAPTEHAATPVADTPIVNEHAVAVGEVLRAARDKDGSSVLLAVVTLSEISDSCYLHSIDGPRIRILEVESLRG